MYERFTLHPGRRRRAMHNMRARAHKAPRESLHQAGNAATPRPVHQTTTHTAPSSSTAGRLTRHGGRRRYPQPPAVRQLGRRPAAVLPMWPARAHLQPAQRRARWDAGGAHRGGHLCSPRPGRRWPGALLPRRGWGGGAANGASAASLCGPAWGVTNLCGALGGSGVECAPPKPPHTHTKGAAVVGLWGWRGWRGWGREWGVT